MRLSPGIEHQILQPHKSFFNIYILFEPDFSDLAYGTRNTHNEWWCVLEKCFFLARFPDTDLALSLSCYPFYTHDMDMCIFIYNYKEMRLIS